MSAAQSWWQRILNFLDVPGRTEQERLTRRMLLIGLLGSVVLTLLSALYAMAALRRGQIPRSPASWIAMAFSNLMLVLQLGFIVLVKRGRYPEVLLRLYIVVISLASLIIVGLTGGIYSSQAPFMLWVLVITTLFLARTRWPLVMLGFYSVVWGFLFLMTALGALRQPASAMALPLLEGFSVITWFTGISLVPVLYLIVRSLHTTFERAEAASQELARSQAALQERMALFEQTLAQRERAFRTLAEVQMRLTEAVSLKALLERQVVYLAEALDYYAVNVFLMDQSRTVLVLQASSANAYADLVQKSFQLSLQERSIVAEAVRSGLPYVAQDVSRDPYYHSTDPFSLTRSEAAFPILARDVVLGVLDVQSVEPNAFDDPTISLLKAVAAALSASIENARQFERMQTAYERLARYQQQNLTETWRVLIQERQERLAYSYDRLAVQPGAARLESLPDEVRLTREVKQYPTPEGTYLLVMPLQVQNQILGRFVLEAERPWLKDEMAVATNVLTQLGLALDNARLLDETRRRAVLEQAAASITAGIRAEVEVDAILQTALETLSRFFQADAASVRLVLPEEG